MTLPSHKKLQTTRQNTRPWKSVNKASSAYRIAGGLAFLMLGAELSALRADEPLDYSLPLPAAAVAAPNATLAPASSAAPQNALPNRPTLSAADSQTIRSSAERWQLRSQQMREAALRAAAQQQSGSQTPPLPMEIAPRAQQSRLIGRPLAIPAAYQQPTGGPAGTAGPSPGGTNRSQPRAQPQQAGPGSESRQMPPSSSQPQLNPQLPGGAESDNLQIPTPQAVTRPNELPKVTQILPYLDYEPDPEIAKTDPCRNLCPRPDGAPCKTSDGRIPECPKEITLSDGVFQPRTYNPSLYAWEASNLYHNPLYFQDVQLERYGHTWPFFIQPVVSIARFTVQAAGLPYQMTIDPPCCRVYPLGYYRPGEYSPKQIHQIPWNTQAALVEAGAVTGVYFLFPHSAWFHN